MVYGKQVGDAVSGKNATWAGVLSILRSETQPSGMFPKSMHLRSENLFMQFVDLICDADNLCSANRGQLTGLT